MSRTQIFIIAATVVIFVYDLWQLLTDQETISDVIQQSCDQHVWLAYCLAVVLGVLSFHLTSSPRP